MHSSVTLFKRRRRQNSRKGLAHLVSGGGGERGAIFALVCFRAAEAGDFRAGLLILADKSAAPVAPPKLVRGAKRGAPALSPSRLSRRRRQFSPAEWDQRGALARRPRPATLVCVWPTWPRQPDAGCTRANGQSSSEPAKESDCSTCALARPLATCNSRRSAVPAILAVRPLSQPVSLLASPTQLSEGGAPARSPAHQLGCER